MCRYGCDYMEPIAKHTIQKGLTIDQATFSLSCAQATPIWTMAMTFTIMLRLASPFILFNVLFNMAIGFINKLAPIVPVYFISTPYQVMGGMLLFYYGVSSLLSLFADGFSLVFR